MIDKVLQAGLAMGMSATDGFHEAKPIATDICSNRFMLLPQDVLPDKNTRLILCGAKFDVEAPIMNIGAWSWSDRPT